MSLNIYMDVDGTLLNGSEGVDPVQPRLSGRSY